MKTLILVVLAVLAVCSFVLTADAGDRLPGGKSYALAYRDGGLAGRVTVSLNADEITYIPGNGDPPIPYDWNPAT